MMQELTFLLGFDVLEPLQGSPDAGPAPLQGSTDAGPAQRRVSRRKRAWTMFFLNPFCLFGHFTSELL